MLPRLVKTVVWSLGLGDLWDVILPDLPSYESLYDPCQKAGSVYLSSTRSSEAEEGKAGIRLAAGTMLEFLSPPGS